MSFVWSEFSQSSQDWLYFILFFFKVPFKCLLLRDIFLTRYLEQLPSSSLSMSVFFVQSISEITSVYLPDCYLSPFFWVKEAPPLNRGAVFSPALLYPQCWDGSLSHRSFSTTMRCLNEWAFSKGCEERSSGSPAEPRDTERRSPSRSEQGVGGEVGKGEHWPVL